jgi:DNA-binding response OmpR family regulator
METQKSVLLVAYQPEFLDPYAEAFAAAGFSVQRSSSLSAGLGAVGPGNVDLLVLSPGIPMGDRRRIEGEAKRRNHNIRIVLLYSGEKERDVFASAILDVNTPANEVVAQARQWFTDAVA